MRKLWMDWLWLAVLFALIVVTGMLLAGGDILLYLAPRMAPMVWFGFAVFIILLIYQLSQIVRSLFQKENTHGGRIGIVLFLVPVLLFFTVTPNQSTPGSLPNQNVKMTGLTAQAETEVKENTEAAASDAGGYPPCVIEEETAVFDKSADLFSQYLTTTLQDLEGKTVTVYGFVYHEDSFPENTVVVSRMMIVCCAADASVVGFYVRLEDGADLKENEWIRVTGTIRGINLEYYGDYYDFPILTDGMIVRCAAPDVDDAYIYP